MEEMQKKNQRDVRSQMSTQWSVAGAEINTAEALKACSMWQMVTGDVSKSSISVLG